MRLSASWEVPEANRRLLWRSATSSNPKARSRHACGAGYAASNQDLFRGSDFERLADCAMPGSRQSGDDIRPSPNTKIINFWAVLLASVRRLRGDPVRCRAGVQRHDAQAPLLWLSAFEDGKGSAGGHTLKEWTSQRKGLTSE